MQPAVILLASDWESFTTRLEAAEEARHLATTAAPDEVLNTRQAADYLGLTPEVLRRARREGRIQAVRLNDKDWGFRRSVLDAYPRRYHRAAQAA